MFVWKARRCVDFYGVCFESWKVSYCLMQNISVLIKKTIVPLLV